MIALHDIHIGYSQNKILTKITHTFKPAQISVVIGENGVGKSSLIKVLTRQLQPLQGNVTIADTSLQSYPQNDFAKLIAYLPQNPTAPDDITVRQLCLAGRFPYKSKWRNYTKADMHIVEEMIQLVGLKAYIDSPLGLLSGGLKQRAWFAMILTQQTEIIILDEPTSFLDVAYQLELLDLLRTLNRTLNKTIIMILHDINHALRYADEIIALQKENDPLIISPEQVSPEFFNQILHVQTHIGTDPIDSKPFAIPVKNTLKKAPHSK